MQKIRKGDLVEVISGADRGKQGHVIAVNAEDGRVRVESVRMQKRHLKPGRRGARQGGVIETEGYIDQSNVLVVRPDTKKPSRTRVKEVDGKRVRVFVTDDEPVPEPVGA